MRPEELVLALRSFGLDEAEAQAYLRLCAMGPSKASQAAEALTIHRSEAYRLLNALVTRGLATASLGRPSLFRAVPADQAMQGLLSRARERVEEMERRQAEVVAALEAVGATRPPTSGDSFRIVRGRAAHLQVLNRMLAEARGSVSTLNTHKAAKEIGERGGAAAAAVACAQRGVPVRVLMANPPPEAALAPANMEIREARGPERMRLIVVDGREVLMSLSVDPSIQAEAAGDVLLWSDAPDLVAEQLYLFECAWAAAPRLPRPKG